MFGLCRVSRGTCFLVLFLGWMIPGLIAGSTSKIPRPSQEAIDTSLRKEIDESCRNVQQFEEEIAKPDQFDRIYAAYKEAYDMLAFAEQTMWDVKMGRASYWTKTRVETIYTALQGVSRKGIPAEQEHFIRAGTLAKQLRNILLDPEPTSRLLCGTAFLDQWWFEKKTRKMMPEKPKENLENYYFRYHDEYIEKIKEEEEDSESELQPLYGINEVPCPTDDGLKVYSVQQRYIRVCGDWTRGSAVIGNYRKENWETLPPHPVTGYLPLASYLDHWTKSLSYGIVRALITIHNPEIEDKELGYPVQNYFGIWVKSAVSYTGASSLRRQLPNMVECNIASYSLIYLAIWMDGTYWDSSGRAAVIPKDPIS